MSFEDTPVWAEVQEIVEQATKRVDYNYLGTLHTEVEDFAVWDLQSVEILRNYLTDIGESGRIVFKMGAGDYVKRFYPYRENLEFTLRRHSSGIDPNEKSNVQVTRYKAIFNPANNPPIGGSEAENFDAEMMNIADMVDVHLELVDRSIEALRIKTTSSVYRNVEPERLIRGIMVGECMKVLIDGKPSIERFDMVPPDNKEPIPNAVFPDGTLMTSVPTFVQHKLTGVYNRGIGTYFQIYEGKKTLFVYPTYDTERFEGKEKRAIFYFVPQEKLPQLDRSYRLDGSILKIAVTAQRRYTDTAELGMMNEGSGYRVPEARSMMRKPVIVTEDGPKASRVHLNHEVAIKERSDGLNYLPVSKAGPTANPYAYRSEVLSRSLGQMDLVWENADPSLIYPGMPCKCVYLVEEKPTSVKGTILFAHIFATRREKNFASNFKTTCRLGIAIEPQSKKPPLPKKGSVGHE